MTCNQNDCEHPGAFRFMWPGRDEAYVCLSHAPKMRAVAAALGLHLQLIPVPPPDGCLCGFDEVANAPITDACPVHASPKKRQVVAHTGNDA